MNLKETATKITDILERLERGEDLKGEDIANATVLSRQLYERLLILQYKTLEQQLESPGEIENDSPQAHPTRAETTGVSEPASSAENGPSFKMGKAEAAFQQISLIDSIEELKNLEQSLNDSLREDARPTLAQKLTKKPIDDLQKAIGINWKFTFIRELFGEDKDAFDAAVKRLNAAKSFIEADEYIQNNLRDRYEWDMQSQAAVEWMDLMRRRHLS